MARKIIAGLASFGMSGRIFHTPLLMSHPDFILKKIVERTKSEVKAIYPAIEITNSFEELLKDDDIELIIVNTPDHTHADFTHQALEAGKNVVVEKPFTQSIGQGEILLNLAHKKGLLLSVFHNRRWDGDFLTVQKVIESKVLGRLVEFESHYDRFRNYIQSNSWKEKPELGTGTLFNLGSHMIDQAITLFGIPEAIHADIRTLRTGGKIDDCYEIKLYYSNIKVSLKGSYLVKEPGPRYMLNGTCGSFLKYGLDPQEDDLKTGKIPGSPGWGTEPEEKWGILNTDINGLHFRGKVETIPGNYNTFYDNIYDSLTENIPPIVQGEDALKVIQVIEAAIESNELRKVIEIR
jgi:scyllo-inositol 2-dehydrogenase (NADP+)